MTRLLIWTWRDPLHHLLHVVYKLVDPHAFQRIVLYKTGCAMRLSVDDLNKTNLTSADPTCLECIVAEVLVCTVPKTE